jgi:hypothetical protein
MLMLVLLQPSWHLSNLEATCTPPSGTDLGVSNMHMQPHH